MNDIKICVLGGDMRQLSAVRTMCKMGYETTFFGLEGDAEDAVKCTTLKGAVCGASVILLPLPFSTDGIRLCCPLSNIDIKLDELTELLSEGQIIAGGKMTVSFCEKVKEKGCIPFDYYDSERFSILNAIPTAEGAVAIAMNEIKITLFGSECAVAGYGRIGRLLAKMLKSLGAHVTVFARSEAALTWAEAEGYTAQNINSMAENISNKHVIFNTVPCVVIDKKVISNTKKDVVIIDLASTPGGVDFEFAKKNSRKVIFALSLPGKVAPETAGKIIADCVVSKFKGGHL